MTFEIAKAGWVQRLSSILRRWKRSWLVLYQDGSLKYFETPNYHTAEGAYRLPTECLAIYIADQVLGDPPTGFERSCMFSVELRDNTTITFCAEEPDDMKAWQLTIEEAKGLRSHAPLAPAFVPPCRCPDQAIGAPIAPAFTPPGGYPGQVIAYPGPDGQLIYPASYNAPPGQTLVANANDPYYEQRGYHHRRGYRGGDLAMGMVGGMALGSLMWGPMLWW